jgi:molybdate transport system substrate-binding protein
LLTNRLVLIAPTDSETRIAIAPKFALVAALGDGRLAMGDPDSVPAGKYGRAALLSLGVWNQVADRIVRADNVRAALAFVARGEAPLGIVYETDARVETNVRVVDAFPESSHPPIVYPAAIIAGAGEGAEPFLDYARGAVARAVFEKYGFWFVQRPGP